MTEKIISAVVLKFVCRKIVLKCFLILFLSNIKQPHIGLLGPTIKKCVHLVVVTNAFQYLHSIW